MATRLQIWIDDQIADRELFAPLGELHAFKGRTLTRDQVRTADALIVRSITRVHDALLRDSRVGFVGSVTAGADHIDIEYLRMRGIHLALAPGFNARPVAEYVLAAVCELAQRRSRTLDTMTIGVVGVGSVGSLVAAWAGRAGLRVLINDPPRAAREGGNVWTPLDLLLAQSDIVSLHVPFTVSGPDATRFLIDGARLALMKRDAVLINTARGGVVDESALSQALAAGRLGGTVIDTWHDEPRINARLLALCEIATPHIAGHSVESRRRGSAMIRAQLSHWVAPNSSEHVTESQAIAPADVVRMPATPLLNWAEIQGALLAACGLTEIDRQMKSASAEIARHFDVIRREAGNRQECTLFENPSKP